MEHILLVFARMINELDVPAVALSFIAVCAGWLMIKAQRSGAVNWGNIFKDSDGKESVARLGMVVALFLSGWFLINASLKTPASAFTGDFLFNVFCVFLGVFSGAKIVEKALDLMISKFGPKPPTNT